MMDKLLKWIDKGAQIAGRVAALFMIAIVVLINVEIILRTVFNTSTFIADEFSGYFLVAVVLMGLAYALLHDVHIRVEVIRSRLDRRTRSIIDALCALAGSLLTLFVAYHALRMVIDAYQLGMTADSISETPLFIPQVLIPVGLLLFALQLIANGIRRLR